MNNSGDFLISYAPVLSTLNEMHYHKMNDQLKSSENEEKNKRVNVKNVPVQVGSYADLFSRRFGPWIRRAYNVNMID